MPIRTIREVLNNECKQDLQAKIDEANGDETPLPAKLLKLLEIFPRSGLKPIDILIFKYWVGVKSFSCVEMCFLNMGFETSQKGKY